MTQNQPNFVDQNRQSNESATRRLTQEQAAAMMQDVNTSVAVLRTEADRARSIFGFGRRILVPPDEIHVVVGDGHHYWAVSNERKVFGQSADRPSRYWLNPLTQVIKLKTISFTVGLHGFNNQGIEALDSSKVSFLIWAHAVAKLNPDKAEIAAQRVGLDTTGLIRTISKVGTAELVAAAATMNLEDIIANRQKLAEIAFPKVNQILSELGYDLALLTVTQLDGVAYARLVEQAESRISKETGIATNREQLAELDDDQIRERHEAEIRAQTEKKLAAERLDAQREVETATISQQESLDIRRHEMEIKKVSRVKKTAVAAHEANIAKVELGQQLGEAETQKDAHLARLKTEREAELRALQHQRHANIKLAETEAESGRLAVEQAKQIERAAALTKAEALRLRQEKLANAERTKEIALVEANQMGEALKLEAKAEAQALETKIDAETRMELIQAAAEATATEKRAQAAKVRAEATKAETAASGLAEAEVDAARVTVAEQQVAVTRAEGLAQAEVAQAQAEAETERLRRLKDVEIEAQVRLASLYGEAPVLVDLERLRMQLNHEETIATIKAETSLKAFEALAPSMKVHIFGNGGQTGQIMNNILTITHGLTAVGEEAPIVAKFLGNGDESAPSNGSMPDLSKLTVFLPYLKKMADDVNPRVFSSLKVSDIVERLGAMVTGEEDLVTALNTLKGDAAFRMVGDMPIGSVLNMMGIGSNGNGEGVETEEPVMDIPIT